MNYHCIPENHNNVISKLFKWGRLMMPDLSMDGLSAMHAAVGIATEAGELAKAVLPLKLHDAYEMTIPPRGKAISPEDLASLPPGWSSPWFGDPGVDLANIVEELGDHLFYEGALRLAVRMEVLIDPTDRDNARIYTTPKLWTLAPPLILAREVSRKKILCHLIDLHVVLAGDILDVVKKHVCYRSEINRRRLFELLMDDCWVVSQICDIIGVKEEQVRGANIRKLHTGPNARYAEGYSDEAAQVRADKAAEEAAETN